MERFKLGSGTISKHKTPAHHMGLFSHYQRFLAPRMQVMRQIVQILEDSFPISKTCFSSLFLSLTHPVMQITSAFKYLSERIVGERSHMMRKTPVSRLFLPNFFNIVCVKKKKKKKKNFLFFFFFALCGTTVNDFGSSMATSQFSS